MAETESAGTSAETAAASKPAAVSPSVPVAATAAASVRKAWVVIDLGEGGRGLRMERASGDVLRGPGPDMAVRRRRRTAAHQGLVGVTKSHQRLIIQRLWPQ
ncbi:hypothetical protein [Streptomyces tubercidicus]|uniref:hypothetical protein n=1 Tax=Streptomyces tubercidicus TaxID=47759 RepID=UPI0037AD372E